MNNENSKISDLLIMQSQIFEKSDRTVKGKYIVNHVMSRDIHSSIFTAIIEYFKQYGSQVFEHIVSIEPLENADIYHYHRPHLESKLRNNSVCTVHHDLNDPDPWHAKFRFIPRYMESAAIICLNQSQKEILIDQGIDTKKLYVIPHGYHSKYLRPKNDSSFSRLCEENNKITLGMASRRYARRVKGEAYLFELAKRLDPKYFNFVFVGQDRTLNTIEMRSLGFEAISYERLPYRMFQSFYENIDILLMCSSHEGGPANTPEAIATGTPIFSSYIGMPKDIIKNNINGLFLTLNPDIDAENIMDICVYNRNKLLNMIKNAKETTSLALSWEQSVLSNISVYKHILDQKN
ncbi:glycosyltransferase family 4 protein [Neisseria weaveri]|uniref:Glycosyl transferases group 1 n=1 Tax=Neisseria weaveri TaxID=28091 RepID=A0A448VPH4_9NEIS|nr:glycosyltransferase family 4 protein [Neisseria weaveri]EGV34975.1 putative glycosyltransferase [Neisseria weaveri ATCC 51223]EGV37454.1 putative glycosyltransferase [Neisseria weaveri LMG 5135]SAY50158.1 Glycosyl transferases group 1 [Neisseria weaveri]VEJ51564.1 Glycosyl transferases group 1 [Neisseria weaveri]